MGTELTSGAKVTPQKIAGNLTLNRIQIRYYPQVAGLTQEMR